MVNPKDDLAFARVVNVPPRGLGKTSMEHLAAAARARGVPLLAMARNAASIPELKEKAIRALEDFTALVDQLSAARQETCGEAINRLLDRTGYRAHLADEAREAAEDRLANLDELVTAACQYEENHPGASIEDFLADITLASAIDRWDQDAGAVSLMTLHAAKGLEFPAVFIVALEEGLLPHFRSQNDKNELEEERRLFFVGITRAPPRASPQPVSFEVISRADPNDHALSVFGRAASRAARRSRSLRGRPIRARIQQQARPLAAWAERTVFAGRTSRTTADYGGRSAGRSGQRIRGKLFGPGQSGSFSSWRFGASSGLRAGANRGDRRCRPRTQGASRLCGRISAPHSFWPNPHCGRWGGQAQTIVPAARPPGAADTPEGRYGPTARRWEDHDHAEIGCQH